MSLAAEATAAPHRQALAGAASPRVAFIAGWGRSGSTLLGLALGQLPGAVFVGEVRDIWTRGLVENRLCGCGTPFRSCGFWAEVGDAAFGGWDRLDQDRALRLRREVDRPWNQPLLRSRGRLPLLPTGAQHYRQLLSRLYEGIGQVSGAEVVVDSSKIATHAHLLVRDSRGVAYSWRKTVLRPDGTTGQRYLARYGPAAAGLRYLVYNAMAEDLARCGMEELTLRYEDLAADPAGSVGRIADFLHLPLPDDLLASLARRRLDPKPTHTVDGNPLRLRAHQAIALAGDEEWREGLPKRERVAVTALTLPLLGRYGYQVSTQRAARPALVPGSPVSAATGATRVLNVCSSGGHLVQLLKLKPWWEEMDRLWVTFPGAATESLLQGERVVTAHHPTTRNIPNAIRNSFLALKVLRSYRPDLVVSTGAGVAFPFFLVAKVLGIRTIYLEVYDRIERPTVTGRLCYPISDLFLLQWEEQRRHYRRGQVIGAVL
jgi:hypothetical protein